MPARRPFQLLILLALGFALVLMMTAPAAAMPSLAALVVLAGAAFAGGLVLLRRASDLRRLM